MGDFRGANMQAEEFEERKKVYKSEIDRLEAENKKHLRLISAYPVAHLEAVAVLNETIAKQAKVIEEINKFVQKRLDDYEKDNTLPEWTRIRNSEETTLAEILSIINGEGK